MYASTTVSRVHLFSRPTIDLAALDDHLTDEAIEAICEELGHTWRERIFTPALTVRTIVYRGLHPDKSIDAVLADMAATAPWTQTPTDAAWCEARDRLPEELLASLVESSAARVIRHYGRSHLWCGRPVYRFDGTTVSMPDTPDLVARFGYANTKHGLSRFPVSRVGVWVAAGPEVVVAYRMDPYVTSEIAQFRDSWDCLPTNAIALFDKEFSTFYDLATLLQRDIAAVTPLHQRRDPHKLIAAGVQLGQNEWRVPLELAPQLRKQYDDPSLPQKLWVRLIRVCYRHQGKPRVLWLVTTLMDPARYPRKAIAALYRDRWTIETRIGTIKVVLDGRVLRSKTADGVRKELAGILLAYDLVWTVIHQAAAHAEVEPDRISFAGAVKVILAFSIPLRGLRGVERRHMYARMLDYVAIHINPRRPHRIEPRLVKRELRRYAFLKEPRAIARSRPSVFSGCESRLATVAPASSNRSSRGGNEAAEASGAEGRMATWRARRP
jgi:hypothetical protein